MPEADLPLARLAAATHFRKQHGLGERGLWATLTDTDLEEVEDLLTGYRSNAQLFSPLLPVTSLPELGRLAYQLACCKPMTRQARRAEMR